MQVLENPNQFWTIQAELANFDSFSFRILLVDIWCWWIWQLEDLPKTCSLAPRYLHSCCFEHYLISRYLHSRYPDIFILALAASNTTHHNIRINMKRGNNLWGWSFGQTPAIRRIDIKFPVASKSGTTFLLNTVSHCRKQNKFMKMNLFNIVLFTHLWSERYDMKVVCSLVFVKIRVPCVGNAWYTTLFWRVLVS